MLIVFWRQSVEHKSSILLRRISATISSKMSGALQFSLSVLISLSCLLTVQLSSAIYLPPHSDDQFCVDKADGNYEYPAPNCTLYYSCSNFITYVQECAPNNLYYNQAMDACDWPESFPLDKQQDCLGIPVEDRTTRVPISTTTTEASPTESLPQPSDDPFCHDKEDGTYEYPYDCGKFYHCSNQLTYIKECPDNLYFNQTSDACEYPESFPEEIQAECQGLSTPAPEVPFPKRIKSKFVKA